MKGLIAVLRGAALVLSHGMCACVAWEYCSLLWGGRYTGFSAPAYTAFFLTIPFGAAIAVCLILAGILAKKAAGDRE